MNEIKVSVVPGDTLSEIAARYDVSLEELQRWNGIKNPDLVQAGQTIVVYIPVDTPIPDLSVDSWNIWVVVVVILVFLLFLFRWKRRQRGTANFDSRAFSAQSGVTSHQPEVRQNGSKRARDIQPWSESKVIQGEPVRRTRDGASTASRAPAVPPALVSRLDRSRQFPPKPTSAIRRPRLPKANRGERLVGKHLKRRYREWTHFNDVLLRSGSGTTQIDHILVSPAGVFVIETKDMKGWIFGSPDQEQWRQSFAAGRRTRRFGTKSKQFRFYNPLLQNEGHARALANLDIIEWQWIRPIVVFVGNAKLKTVGEFLPFDGHEKIACQNPKWRMRGVICMSLRELHRYIAFSANLSSNPELTRQKMEIVCGKIRTSEIPMTPESYEKHIEFVQSVKGMKSE